MSVRFNNPAVRLAHDGELIKNLVAEAAASGRFILKGNVAAFERAVQEVTGARHAIAVASGSDALKLSLAAAGVGAGSEVLVPAYAFAAVANAVNQRGATPVFVDVDSRSGCLAEAELAEAVTAKTRAILAVHTLSNHADVTAIRRFADQRGLFLVEDAAVTFGASINGRPAGRWGDAGVFSFFPIKQLGGIGESGAIITDHAETATRCRMFRNHGQDGVTRFLHHFIGYNSRMDEITAGYLMARIVSLPGLLDRRAIIAAAYDAAFRSLAPAVDFPPGWDGKSAWYTFTILTDQRDRLQAWLSHAGIESRVFYTPLLPLQPAFSRCGRAPGRFPNAQRFASQHLCLPVYPEMTDDQVSAVIEGVLSFFVHSAWQAADDIALRPSFSEEGSHLP